MPQKKTTQRARKAARKGKAPSTQAGAYVKEEMEHVRQGKHGAKSSKQAIAIGLNKARRAGVKVKPPSRKASASTRKQAARATKKGQTKRATKTSAKRSRATVHVMKKRGRSAASSRQSRSTAARRRKAA